jgi:FAD/FMN-containing dehydrogenase
MAEKKDALITLVGAENVSDDLKTREEFSRDNSFCHPKLPALVVRPRHADDVQAVVQWANRTKTPLVPVSSGAPHFRGDSVPGADGAVIVDLSGMNRIIMVDRKNRVALVEPGVTYGTLQSELARNGMRLSMPLKPRATKSVLGSLLEREPILNPRYAWSLNEPLRCIEVVMGNGEMFRTGELAGAGVSTAAREEARLVPIEELLEQRKKIQYSALYQYGPGQFNFHKLVSAAQGTMGIVTWASLRCEVLPRAQKFFLVPSENLQDIIGFAYKLLRIRFHDELLLLNRSSLAAVLGADAQQAAGLREQFPPWVLVVGLTGRDILPEERVAFMEKDVTAIAQQFSLRLETAIPGATGEQVAQTVLSPSPAPYWKLRAGGGCQDIFFLTTLNKMPEFVKTMNSLAQAADYPLSDLGMYVQPTHLGTSCHVEFSMPYDPESATEVARVQSLFTNASNRLSEQGAFFSRPYGIWAALAYARNTEHARLTKKLKDIFDPNTVLNPGKLCF